MKSITRLYNLINKLSPTEKRYFKRYTSLYSDKSDQDYLKIFDVISKFKKDSLGELKSEVNKLDISNLSMKTRYLYNLVLDVLVDYKRKGNPENGRYRIYDQILILKQFGFIEEALELVKKAKKRAWEKEQFSFLFELLEEEYQLIVVLQTYSQKVYKTWIEEKNKVKDVIENQIAYENIKGEIWSFLEANQHSGSGNINQKIDDFIKERPLLHTIENAQSIKAKLVFFQISNRLHFYRLPKDIRKFHQSASQAIQFLETLAKDKVPPSIALDLFSNYISACFHTNDFDGFKKSIEKSKKYVRDDQHRAIIFHLQYGVLLDFYNQKEIMPESADDFIVEFLKQFNNYDTYLYANRKKNLFYDFLFFCIKFEKYEHANNWIIHFLETEKKIQLNIQEQILIKLIKMIFYKEDNLYPLIQREISSAQYFIKRYKLKHEGIDEIILLFKTIAQTKKNTEQEFALQKSQETLANIDRKLEESFWTLDMLFVWINTKLEKITSVL